MKSARGEPTSRSCRIDDDWAATAGEEGAIHGQGLAGGEAGGRRCEVDGGADQLGCFPEASERRVGSEPIAARAVFDERSIQLGGKNARRNGVYANAVL